MLLFYLVPVYFTRDQIYKARLVYIFAPRIIYMLFVFVIINAYFILSTPTLCSFLHHIVVSFLPFLKFYH